MDVWTLDKITLRECCSTGAGNACRLKPWAVGTGEGLSVRAETGWLMRDDKGEERQQGSDMGCRIESGVSHI